MAPKGWLGGAMVLGKLPVPSRPTNLDYSMARAYCACSRCGWGSLDVFLSSIISLSFLLSLGDCLIETEILSQRADKPNITNQPIMTPSLFKPLKYYCTIVCLPV